MQEDRKDAAKTDEDGRGGDEEYEINSMGKPVSTVKVATMSQHTRRKDKGYGF